MKKVMIGILILIPIIILLIIAIVSNLLAIQAWVAVEDIAITAKNSDARITSLNLSLSELAGEKHNFSEFLNVKVLPEKANKYTLEWEISSVRCTDSEYQKEYDDYINSENSEEEAEIYPAAMLVNGQEQEVTVNTSGEFIVSAYCEFAITVHAETVSKTFSVFVRGYTVESAQLKDASGNDSGELKVGESVRLVPHYSPIDSLVNELSFESDNDSVAVVDPNGVVTAKGVGSARIIARASKYQEDDFVESSAYTVTVAPGASKWGDSVTVHRRAGGAYTFDELGLTDEQLPNGGSFDGYTVDKAAKTVTINGESARVALSGDKSLLVTVCEENAIAIENAALYNFTRDGDFVLAVSPLTLKLKAVWASALQEGVPSVTWTSSAEEVATVSDGEVVPLSSGIAIITATCGDKTAQVVLNVQQKVSSLRLLTSNESLAIGLAMQTVFPSQKYIDADVSNEKEPNSFLVRVYGEPEDGASLDEINYFYTSYNFDIVEGAEYAHFDSERFNRVIFDSAALSGKGMQPVKVRVSARYPRYEGVQQLTVEEVTLNVVYGVSVTTWDEMLLASQDQKNYAFANKISDAGVIDELLSPDGTTYYVGDAARSSSNYSMVLDANLTVPKDKFVCFDENEADGTTIRLYGNLYGNNHLVSAVPSQVQDWRSSLVYVCWSDVTVSNVIIRQNELDEDEFDKSKYREGYCLTAEYDEPVADGVSNSNYRLHNINLEYSILENSYGGMRPGFEMTVTGCVIRNISGVGIYAYARVNENYLVFSHVTTRNCVFSQIFGSSMSFAFENYSTIDLDGSQDRDGRFTQIRGGSSDDRARGRQESLDWMNENLVPRGYTHILDQTGFIDIYNWQKTSNATLIDTGNDTTNGLISTLCDPLIMNHPEFAPGKYEAVVDDTPVTWFHIGFIESGIQFPKWDEYPNMITNLEDDRFFSIYARTLQTENIPGVTGLYSVGLNLLSTIEIKLYCYKNTADISPMSTYQIDTAFISRLHS